MNSFTHRFALTLIFLCSGFTTAQKLKDDESFIAEKPTLGEKIPDLTVLDDDGKEIRLSSLKGHPVVLVFGCLT